MPKKKKEKTTKKEPVTKKDKKKGIRALLEDRYKNLMGVKESRVIPTGFKPLDKLLGGGFARAQYNIIVGYEGSGKTTLMLQIIRSAQKMGLLPIIFDTEFAMSRARMVSFGIDLAETDQKLGSTSAIYIQPDTIETISSMLDDIARWKHAGNIPRDQGILMVWDSISSTPTDVELEGSVEDANVALASRIISKFVKKYAKYFEPLDITLLIVCQYREKIQIDPFAKKVNPLKIDAGKSIPGGNALKFKAFQLLGLEPTKTFEITSKRPIGRIVKMKTLKNKLTSPLLEYDSVLTYTRGFNNHVDMLNALITNKFLVKAGQRTLKLKGFRDNEKKKDYLAFEKGRFFKLLKEDEEFREKCFEYYNEVCERILNPVKQADEIFEGKEFIEEESEDEEILSVREMIEEIENG